jgi:hypothetical protein
VNNIVPIDCLKEKDIQEHIDFEDWTPDIAGWVSYKIHYTFQAPPGNLKFRKITHVTETGKI